MWTFLNGFFVPLIGWWLKRSGMKEEEAKRFLETVKLLQRQNRLATTQPADDLKASKDRLRELEKPKDSH